ncbi:glycosyltransferase [Azospirillum sp. YIM B02556]|uniref:Glycosyltransferase n=1 Tax=Azospirillum endophyticum TaxID=2800326 RepID=A0ABS1FBQ0_9PROT|nr:glycosyltransferase [Azospirillum endophyticum]MBK1840807.1 glycosyltransferase [Azospirillum endophyticum]
MRTASCSPIPRLIHQTWKTRDIPPGFQPLRRSWIERNPGFAYRFWTDEDIEGFIAEEHPALLPVFRGYANPISRIDLARYLILRRFGGVYADLDFECLRPIDGLLDSLPGGAGFVVGLEPEEHGRLAKAVERGLPRILCPSFLASVPDHPFLDHLLARLVEARHCADVLDATGPFLLTRAHAEYEAAHGTEGTAAVAVLPPELLYPVTKEECWSGRLFDPVFWEQATRRAYAIHYWEGTWFREGAGHGVDLPRQVAAVVTDGRPENARSPVAKAEGLPLISCLMVTRGRAGPLEFAIDGFARQTYPNRELVIVCDSPALPQDDPLERAIGAAGCPNIRLVRVEAVRVEAGKRLGDQPGGLTLGELRNIAVDHAAGRYVCQWDDDDLYDPCRLEMQQLVLAAAGAHACLLGRWMIWWPAQARLAVSAERDWEGSLLCEKAVMPRYPALRQGEDTPVVKELRRSARVVRMDMPRLYTYVVHGGNTFAASHFETQWQLSTARFGGERCRALLEEMGKRLPVEGYRQAVAAFASAAPAIAGALPEKVLVLTPVKDAVAHLPRYLELLGRLDHDRSRLSLGFLEGDSGDGTHDWLAERLPELRQRYRRVTLLRHGYGFRPEIPRWRPEIQRRRRELLARSRNRLLSGALGDEDWVLWLDADLVDYPPELLARLLAAGRDIVVPHCVRPDGRTFDLNSFRVAGKEGGEEDPRHLVDGIFQPPRGAGRLYLDAFAGEAIVPLDGVGGTALLVRADLHREGLCFPSYSHRGYIETEGLAMMARDMGVTAWGLPDLRIVHADH